MTTTAFADYLIATAYDKVERSTRRTVVGWRAMSDIERHDVVMQQVASAHRSLDSELNLLANAQPSLSRVQQARAKMAAIVADPSQRADREETVVAIALGVLDSTGRPVANVSGKLRQSPKLRLGKAIRSQADRAACESSYLAAERGLRRPIVLAGSASPIAREPAPQTRAA